MTVSIILFVLSILIFIIGLILIKNTHSVNKEVHKYNAELEEKKLRYLAEIKISEDRISNLKEQQQEVEKSLSAIKNHKAELQEDIEKIQNDIVKSSEKQEKIVRNAFMNYCDLLDKDYQQKNEEYDLLVENLKNAYSKEQLKLIAATDEIRADLSKIENTRAAALAAQIKEKEIKEKLSFYCLQPKQSELSDIKKLERLKPELNNPRILSMLIWSTYFQKPMTTLCNNVLGTKTVCGIYKITNQLTGECYVGQSVNASQRFKEHAKYGLGIDTPEKNKLYKAMIEDGIWNFSWELLEECPQEQLDEKEKYYIKLYQSYDFGYNSNKGNSK